MSAPTSAEFRRRAVQLARRVEKPIRKTGHDLGSPGSCLRRWMRADVVDAGRAEGATTDEHAQLARLRRELRGAELEIEILDRTSAYFARELLPVRRERFGWRSLTRFPGHIGSGDHAAVRAAV